MSARRSDASDGTGGSDSAVSVSIRIRPLNDREKKDNQRAIWAPHPEHGDHISSFSMDGKPVVANTFAFGMSPGRAAPVTAPGV